METYEPMGHARALRWAAQHMTTILEAVTKEEKPDQLQAAGSFFARIIVAALAAEVALKALYKQESGKEPKHEHELAKRFSALAYETQQKLDLRFQGIRATQGPRRATAKTIAQVFQEHNDDFERWRYIYENASGSSIELLDLDPAIEAVLQEYASRAASGSAQ